MATMTMADLMADREAHVVGDTLGDVMAAADPEIITRLWEAALRDHGAERLRNLARSSPGEPVEVFASDAGISLWLGPSRLASIGGLDR